MPHQYLWSLALALVPAALILRALGFFDAKPEQVPIEIDRSDEEDTDPR
jgi:hypothetical protein